MFFKSDAELRHSSPQRYRVKEEAEDAAANKARTARNGHDAATPFLLVPRALTALLNLRPHALSALDSSSAEQGFLHSGSGIALPLEGGAPLRVEHSPTASRAAIPDTADGGPDRNARTSRAALLLRRRALHTADW